MSDMITDRLSEKLSGRALKAFDAIVDAYDPHTPASDGSVMIFVQSHRQMVEARDYAILVGGQADDYRRMFDVLDYAGVEQRNDMEAYKFVLDEMDSASALYVMMDETGRVDDILCS